MEFDLSFSEAKYGDSGLIRSFERNLLGWLVLSCLLVSMGIRRSSWDQDWLRNTGRQETVLSCLRYLY